MSTTSTPRAVPATGPGHRRVIVADDLTGAADACAKFVVHGYSGAVLLDLDAPPSDGGLWRVEVLAVNADTRHLSPGDAVARVERAGRLSSAADSATAFKKIDSTLRGHIGREIEAGLAAFASTHAIVAPSFPAMSRIVRHGRLVVRGPGAPPPCEIAEVLAAQGLPGAVAVPHPGGHNDRAIAALTAAIERSRDAGARALIFDAESDLDLRAIVAAGLAAGGRPLWAGSAGLAGALATHLASEERRPSGAHLRPKTKGRAILCLGSTHAVTQAQRDTLMSERRVTVVQPHSTPRGPGWDARSGVHLLITTDAPRESAPLLELVRDAVTRPTSGLVLSGGDTAAAVCAVLGATAIQLGGEVATGIPWGVLHGGRAEGLPVVLKAGGFGATDALVAAVDFLSSPAERHADA